MRAGRFRTGGDIPARNAMPGGDRIPGGERADRLAGDLLEMLACCECGGGGGDAAPAIAALDWLRRERGRQAEAFGDPAPHQPLAPGAPR